MLDTRLFAAPFAATSHDRTASVHGQIAELLGARTLARLVDAGLPTRRILSLTTGRDGTVVSELRGLGAWSAAHLAALTTAYVQDAEESRLVSVCVVDV